MKLRLPELSKNSEGAIITLWHKKENECVVREQDLLEIATDKATFDIPSPCDGILVKIIKKPGEKVKTNEIIGELIEVRS